MPNINLSGVPPQGASRSPPPFELTPQQKDAINFCLDPRAGNAILTAVAGSGKTSTLIEICKVLSGSVAFAAFNKKIADEIGRKLLDAGVPKNVKASTFHSFGFQSWLRVAPRIIVEAKKSDILMDYLSLPRNLRGFCATLVSIAKQAGVGIPSVCKLNDYMAYDAIVEHHDLRDKLFAANRSLTFSQVDDLVGQGIEWAQKLLLASIEDNTTRIDFDDMLYAPLYHQSSFWQNDWVLVDEAQDTNPVRRMLAEAMLKRNGRLMAVGDPHQAIYGFTGASADALDQIRATFNAIELPLTVSFRCPQAVVRHAQQWVSHIEAAPSAAEGSVSFMDKTVFMQRIPDKTDAIICRNTKPLIQLALFYIRRGVAAHVEGRDIGQSLLALVNRWRQPRTVAEFRVCLGEYTLSEMERLSERGEDAKIEQLQDRVESIYAIMETLRDDDPIERVADKINSIFKDTEGRDVQSITLSTIHKAKGREWNRVFFYGRNIYNPSPFARQLWQIEQENNLIYVGITRAKQELVEVVLEGRE